MPITLQFSVTLDDATLAAIRGGAAPVVVPPVVTVPPVTTNPPVITPPSSGGNGTPVNSVPALARVNGAPCMWAVYSNEFMSSQENGPLALLIGTAELGRRLQHYTYNNPVKGYAEKGANGIWAYQYQPTGTDQWLPWTGPGDPPGQVPYGGVA
jgi:hypothetical protein